MKRSETQHITVDVRPQRIKANRARKEHAQSGGLSFADGHAEIKHWRDSKMINATGYDVVPAAGATDLQWLQDRSTTKL